MPLNKHVQQSRPLPQRPRRERPVARVVLFLLPPHALPPRAPENAAKDHLTLAPAVYMNDVAAQIFGQINDHAWALVGRRLHSHQFELVPKLRISRAPGDNEIEPLFATAFSVNYAVGLLAARGRTRQLHRIPKPLRTI